MRDVSEILKETEHRMQVSLQTLSRDLVHLRAGRANPGLVDHIRIEAYGTEMPLNQLANISTPDASTLLISPFDKQLAGAIERAINKSDLGLMPHSDGSLIRINVPPLTEERRNDLLKAVNKLSEESRVALRNVRRDVNEHIKKLQKSKELSEDEMHHHLEQVDKVLERNLADLDQMLYAKQREITEF